MAASKGTINKVNNPHTGGKGLQIALFGKGLVSKISSNLMTEDKQVSLKVDK